MYQTHTFCRPGEYEEAQTHPCLNSYLPQQDERMSLAYYGLDHKKWLHIPTTKKSVLPCRAEAVNDLPVQGVRAVEFSATVGWKLAVAAQVAGVCFVL